MKSLYFKNGNKCGMDDGITVAELREILKDAPDDLVVVGTWEGICVPVRSAVLIKDDKYISGQFIKLDVDEIG